MKGCVRSQRPYGDLSDINGLILMKLARVVCWDQEVKDLGHKRPKIDLEVWQRHYTRPRWVEGPRPCWIEVEGLF